MKGNSIIDTIEKLTGEKISREEKKETTNIKQGSALKKYWEDVKSGKIKRVAPWSKKKAQKKEEVIKKEPEKEEQKTEIKLDKTPFDKESEEVKKELEAEINNDDDEDKKEGVVKKEPIIEIRELKKVKEHRVIDFNLLILGFFGIVAVYIITQAFKRRESQPVLTQPQQRYREFDIGNGRVIKVPVR